MSEIRRRGYFCTKCMRNHIGRRSQIYWEHHEYGIDFSEIEEAIEEACMDRQMKVEDLLAYYIKEGLKNEGVIE